MRERNKDYARAMVRTDLAIKLFKQSGNEIHYNPIMWILNNHILQAFFRCYGVDVIPLSAGDMYGYGRYVKTCTDMCFKTEVFSKIATGSSRIEYNGDCFYVKEKLKRGEDFFRTIDEATKFAIGGEFPSGAYKHKNCLHREEADVYLTVHQILTLLVCMGYCNGILGRDGYGPDKDLVKLGLATEEQYYITDYFFMYNIDNDVNFCVNRHTGNIVIKRELKIIPFDDWCGNSVEQGLKWIIDNISLR